MGEWKEVRLGDICTKIGSGATPSGGKDAYKGGEFALIRSQNVIDFKFSHNGLAYINDSQAQKLDGVTVETRDILLNITGDSVARTCMVDPSILPARVNQHVAIIRVNPEVAAAKFIHAWLIYKKQELLNLASFGATRNAITKRMIENFTVKLPPIEEQKKIAEVLSSLDDKIETNRKINARLEELAQALFKSWFIDFEPFGGKMPEGWEKVTLADIGEIVGGATPSKAHTDYYTSPGNGIAWLTPKDLSETKAKFTERGSEDITELGYLKCCAKVMPAGSVLFSSRAPIGYVSISLNEICTNQGFKSFVPSKVGTAFAYYLLKALTPEIENKATGSTFKEASGSLMKSLTVVLPSEDILGKFEKICAPIFDTQRDYQKETARLAQLRDALLPKLMSGKIEVG